MGEGGRVGKKGGGMERGRGSEGGRPRWEKDIPGMIVKGRFLLASHSVLHLPSSIFGSVSLPVMGLRMVKFLLLPAAFSLSFHVEKGDTHVCEASRGHIKYTQTTKQITAGCIF